MIGRVLPGLGRLIAAVALLAFVAGRAGARTTSDQPSSILVFPYIVANASQGVDTNLRLMNTSLSDTAVRCFYEDQTRHCDADMSVCDDDHPCSGQAACVPGFVITEFVLRMGLGQSLEWQLSAGLADVPPPGAGAVPPAPEQPFVGVLRCVAVDASGVPSNGDWLVGSATVQTARRIGDRSENDWARYNAVGLQALSDVPLPATELRLGGPDGQFAGCNNVQILTHSFDGARSAANPGRTLETTVVIVPCASDLHAAIPATVTVGYSSVNEFDQRIVSGTFTVSGQRIQTLGRIDPLLTAAAAGTVTGQTRFTRVEGGAFVALAIESHRPAGPDVLPASAAFNLPGQGDLEEGDVLRLPPFGTPATPTVTPTASRTRTPTATPLPPDAYEPDNRIEQAQPIACGETQSRSNHVRRDEDWARLTLSEPSGIEINAVGPGLSLYDAGGGPLSGSGLGRIVIACGEQQLPAGTYYVNADGPPFSVIPLYNLSLHCTACTTPTPTPSASITPTASSTATQSATVTATAAPCPGDCDANGTVSVDELVRGVNILLGSARVSRCSAFDVSQDGRVSVDELVKGVNSTLKGCN